MLGPAGRTRTIFRLGVFAVFVVCVLVLTQGAVSSVGSTTDGGPRTLSTPLSTTTQARATPTSAATTVTTASQTEMASARPTASPIGTRSTRRAASTTAPTTPTNRTPAARFDPKFNRSSISVAPRIPPNASITVVATQGLFVSDEEAELTAFTDTGRVLFHHGYYNVYFDVDPVPGTRYTVEYLAATVKIGNCPGEGRCSRTVLERANLSTGTITTRYSTITPGVYGTRWHDADRLNDTHYVVADIANDRVFILDHRDGSITWQWNASAVYPPSAGGTRDDWTHVNDVEVLADGRIMVSLRNMDSVVFLRPGVGMLTEQTLGRDDDRSILYEQHNPDYIPADRGGPAVLVSDSENNRIVEYHRTRDGGWERSWLWRDARLQWPRDADRLPTGNTLITDSHGDRVLEVAPNGTVVWSVAIGMPYDAERLGTGDESATGTAMPFEQRSRTPSSATASPTSGGTVTTRPSTVTATESTRHPQQTVETPDAIAAGGQASGRSITDTAVLTIKDTLPSIVVNGLLYLSPSWIHFVDLLAILVLVCTTIVWVGVELYWSSVQLRTLLRSVTLR